MAEAVSPNTGTPMIRTGSPADLTPSHIAISGRHACKSLYSDGLTCTVLSYQEFGVGLRLVQLAWLNGMIEALGSIPSPWGKTDIFGPS